MTVAPAPDDVTRWATKQRALDAQLQGFWAEERWPMRLCPLPQLAADVRKPMTLRFQVQSPGLRTECKYCAGSYIRSVPRWR